MRCVFLSSLQRKQVCGVAAFVYERTERKRDRLINRGRFNSIVSIFSNVFESERYRLSIWICDKRLDRFFFRDKSGIGCA